MNTKHSVYHQCVIVQVGMTEAAAAEVATTGEAVAEEVVDMTVAAGEAVPVLEEVAELLVTEVVLLQVK